MVHPVVHMLGCVESAAQEQRSVSVIHTEFGD